METRRLEDLRIERKDAPRNRRKPFWWAAALALVVLIVVVAVWLGRPARPEVQTAIAEAMPTMSRSTVLNASGYVTARRQATVSSKITGRVTDVLVEEGMEVEQGQLLAKLDASMQSRSLRLVEAQVEAAESSLQETRVRIAEATIDLWRASRLAEEEVASQENLDRAQAQLDALRARLAAQQDELSVARRQFDLRRQDVEDTEIRAPFAGIVVSKNAQEGEMISPISAGGGFTRTGICTIVDMDSLEIEVDVNEAYIQRVTTGQPVEAALDAYPGWKIPAHVITVVPTANREKATVRVRIAIDEKDPRILPDMGVKVSFIAREGDESPSRGVEIPREAVHRDGDRDVVFVVRDGVVERRAVRVRSADGPRVEVIAGLEGGEEVVVDAPAGLEDGQRVTVRKREEA